MRNRSTLIINGIFAVALLSAAVLAFHFLRTSDALPSDAEPITAVPAPPPPDPWLPRLAEPRAVLVLDVSGSMGVVSRPSDGQRLQTVAALRFFDIYARMWDEVSGNEGDAGIAVILFGTVAQTIDWSGDGVSVADSAACAVSVASVVSSSILVATSGSAMRSVRIGRTRS